MNCRRYMPPADQGPGQRTGSAGASAEPNSVAANVRRLIILREKDQSLLTSAATNTRDWRRAVVSGVLGLAALVTLAWVGGDVRKQLHLPLPGPVIGLALLALLWLLAQRFHARSHQQLTLHLTPVSRLLVAHLGLLFVPAGVGIITEGEAIRKEWLPLVAGLAGSTLIGLAATGWFMHRFAPKPQPQAHES